MRCLNAMIRLEFQRRDRSLLEVQLSLSTWSPSGIPIRESAAQHALLWRAIFQSQPMRQQPRPSSLAVIRPQVAAAAARRGADIRGSRGTGSRLSTATPSLRRAAAPSPRFAPRRPPRCCRPGLSCPVAARSSPPLILKNRPPSAACGKVSNHRLKRRFRPLSGNGSPHSRARTDSRGIAYSIEKSP